MPAGLLPWVKPQFTDAAGDPVASGKLYSFIAGTDTPQPTYSDVDLTIANANPTLLNAAGQSPTSLYLLPTGYKFRLDTAADVPLWTVDNVEDVGAVFAAGFGQALTAGGKGVSSGYTALPTDRLITVSSSGGPDPCLVNLLPASEATQALVIKNVGDIALSVVPNASDVLDGENAAYTVAGAVDPVQPTIWLAPDGVGAWYILASHGGAESGAEGPVSGEPTIPDYSGIVATVLARYHRVVPSASADAGKAQLTRAVAWEIYQTDTNVGLFEKTTGTNILGLSVDLVVQLSDGHFADVASESDNGDGTVTILGTWQPHVADANTSDHDRWVAPTLALAETAGPMTLL